VTPLVLVRPPSPHFGHGISVLKFGSELVKKRSKRVCVPSVLLVKWITFSSPTYNTYKDVVRKTQI
jgi:hypothetical protein